LILFFWFHHSNIERWNYAWHVRKNINTIQDLGKVIDSHGGSPHININAFNELAKGWESKGISYNQLVDPRYGGVTYDGEDLPHVQAPGRILRGASSFSSRARREARDNITNKTKVVFKNINRSAFPTSFTLIAYGVRGDTRTHVWETSVFSRSGESCENCGEAPLMSVHFVVDEVFEDFKLYYVLEAEHIPPEEPQEVDGY